MPLKCEHCHEEAFDVEEQVCTACGIVNESIQFGVENNHGLSFKPYERSQRGTKGGLHTLSYATDILDSLCHEFNVAGDVKMSASTLLNFAYSAHTKAKKSFRYKEDAGVLAGCCLLSAQKEHRQFITLTNLCAKLKCPKKKAFRFSKLLRSYLSQNPLGKVEASDWRNVNDKAIVKIEEDGDFLDSLDSVVNTVLSKFSGDKKAELVEKTLKLTKLAYDCWLLSGRSREGVITAAAFLCWKSMNAVPKSMSLIKFCEDFSFNISKARPRVPELRNMLLKLGQNIPSLTTNYVNEENLLFHLNYILENSTTLRNDFLVNECTADSMNKKEYNLYRAEFQKEKMCPNSAVSIDSNMNASDVEISDTEISSYIRSEEQVNFIKKLKESKDSDKSDESN